MKRYFSVKEDFAIPIISVGNIIVGGSGKTPITIKLASKYEDVAVVLRGYGRDSKGLFVVSHKGEIEVDVSISGDEAMLLAKSLKKATVIVSEDRKEAIKKAKQLSCKIVFLDDGFSKYSINKFDILLKSKNEPTNNFCLPSGGYRELKSSYKKANLILKEDIDFKRVVTIKKDGKLCELTNKVLLLTAISKPKRLLEFLPKNSKMISFPDHHNFTSKEIESIIKKYYDFSIITTSKDLVKLEKFNIAKLYLLDLDIKILNHEKLIAIDTYITTNVQ